MRARRGIVTLPFAVAGLVTLLAGAVSDRSAEARAPQQVQPDPLDQPEPFIQGGARSSVDSSILRSYRWRALGPDRGGRSIAVSGVRGRPNEAYFGAVGGGLWKTTDGGENWAPVTDGQIRSSSVGAVAVSESNPDIVWIGMGETCIRGNIMSGDGVYKSTDAGKTWTHMGFASSENISKIRIHPLNPDIIWVAAFGKHSADNADRGVFKSIDGGKTWKKVLYRNDKTGAIDLTIDRTNPNVMFAAMWEAYRKDFTMSSGGTGSGLFKSTDGGDTWNEVTRAPGMPQSGLIGRIGVAISGANPNKVYALVEHEKGGLFASNDAGRTWSLVNENRNIRQRAFYYTHVFADPKDENVVYLQNVSMYRSTDGGKTLGGTGGTHSDHHDLWIDPDNSAHLVDGNDGGGAVSTNTGQSWTAQDFPTAQWYHVATTAHIPYHVCGAQQDNSTLCVPSNYGLGFGGRGGGGGGGGRGGPAAPPRDPTQGAMAVSYVAGGGEPGYIAPDPLDPDQFFSGTNNGGYLDKFNRRTGRSKEVNPYPWFYSGEPSSEIPERWQWTFPILFSKANPKLLFTSSQRLWKTLDGGKTWTAISGDLTRHDPKTMGHSGGPITGDMNGPEVYAVIFSVGPGKKNQNVVWTGSDDGLVHVTKDGGKTWANVTPKDLPEFSRISQIDASAFNDGAAYFTARRQLWDDKAPYIYRTTDFGKTWTKIVNGVRRDEWMHTVREDPTRKGLLYAGGQNGVYISYNDGDSWESLSLNLPDTPISDLVVEANDLVISTHGRGFYVLDNIGPLRQYNAQVASSTDGWLFAPPTAIRSAGGANFTYLLKKAPRRVTIDVMDSTGKMIRTFAPPDSAAQANAGRGGGGGRGGFAAAPPTAIGLNRYAWDLRFEPAASFPGMILWGAGVAGPYAPPGKYKVRITADGYTQTQDFRVVRNPLYTDVSDADLRAQFNLALQIRDKVTEANQGVIDARRIKTEAADRMGKNSDAKLKSTGEQLTTNLSDVEDDLYQVKNQSGQDPLNFPIRINNRMASLLSMVLDGDGAPVNGAYTLFEEYKKLLKVQTDRLGKVIATDLTAFNNELRRLNLPTIAPPCPTGQKCTLVP
jgi:photosystem II stability/assembly factor-like uncharacterized protein